MLAIKAIKLDRMGTVLSSAREMAGLYFCKHPNVVKYIDSWLEIFEGRGCHSCIAMELCKLSLHSLIEREKCNIPLDCIKVITGQITSGLQYIHDRGIIHRDLKPENILLHSNGTAKIADFGLSILEINGLPRTPQMVTLRYRSPEILLGSTNYNRSVDVWSLGCILAEMLLGEPLFEGNSQLSMIQQISKYMGPITDSLKHLDLPGLDQVEGTWQRCNRAVDSLSQRLSRDDSSKMLVYQLLQVNPNERITCQQALTFQLNAVPFLSRILLLLATSGSSVSSNVPSRQDPSLGTHHQPAKSTASADVNSDITTERSGISCENQTTKNVGKTSKSVAVKCAQCIKKRKLQQILGHGSNAPSPKRPAVEGLSCLSKRKPLATLPENRGGKPKPRVTGIDYIGADHDVHEQGSQAPIDLQTYFASGPKAPSKEPPVIEISSDEEDLDLNINNMNSTNASQVISAVRPTLNNDSPEVIVIVDDS